MSMTWDAPLVSALARELAIRLKGDRLRAHIFRWEEREITLFFRSGTLRWPLHPGRGWVTLDPPGEIPPEARPLSAQLQELYAPPDERILEMRLRRARGKVRRLRVVFELMTNQWNALLMEEEEERIRHLLWTRHLEDRPLVVGQKYRPPEPSSRRGIQDPFTAEEWRNLLMGKTEEEARKILMEEVAFTSSTNLPELLSGPELGSPESLEVWQGLRKLDSTPSHVLEIGRNKQPYPIPIRPSNHTSFPDLLSAIRAVSEHQPGESDAREPLLEEADRALYRAGKRVSGIRKEMAEAADPTEPRDHANLLLARLTQLSRGADKVTLDGFMGEDVEIPLNPTLSPRENAEALYEEAARRERAQERLPALLEEAEAEVRSLEGVKAGLLDGSVMPAEARGILPGGLKKAPGKKQGERLPYRVFQSSGGLEIRVGRGSKDNDALTFGHSHPQDIWLHARDSAGAHVILRWTRKEKPPRKDLAEAAILAALNSGSRSSGTVPVDWTRRKYVRKARKSPPGTVIPQEVQTLFVEPDPDLPKRLTPPRPSPP
jgi:predicted ribosome quality control (RQC) complex YloA/Tae2 family protein